MCGPLKLTSTRRALRPGWESGLRLRTIGQLDARLFRSAGEVIPYGRLRRPVRSIAFLRMNSPWRQGLRNGGALEEFV
jgi:hypothetical protein